MPALPGGRQMDYAGRPIGPLRLARAMAVNIVAGALIMASIAVMWPTAAITAVFLREQLGASKLLIGMNLTLCTCATVLALPGAWVFSRMQRRKLTWMAITTAARVLMFAPAVVAILAGHSEWRLTLIWITIVSFALVNVGGVFTSPGWWSWMADLIPESILGSFFGRRYKWLLLAQCVAALSAGIALDVAGRHSAHREVFFVLFLLAAVLAVIDPLLFAFVPEPARPRPPVRTLRETARDYLAPFRDRGFRDVLLGAGAYGFFFFLPNVFFALFLRGEALPDGGWIGGRAGIWLLAMQMVVLNVATALSSNLWGQLADRIGHRIVWILGSLAYFTYVAYFFINEDNYIPISLGHALLFGLFFGGQAVAVQNMALSMAPVPLREFYMSVFIAVTQMATGLAPVFGGWLADRYRVIESITLPSGQPACYIHLLLAISFAGVLITLPVMVKVPDPRGDAVLPWVGRLITGDLWRMAHNISVLGSAAGTSRRVRALRRITHRDGNVLLGDIVAALNDPDLAIRREALLALGRLGTPEALDVLRWYLHEPDAMLRAPSVEAIAQTQTPDRASLLRRALHDPDRRVRRAAANALALSGDRDAAGDLCGLLSEEPDGEVLVSVAVALSKLKEFGAVRQMLDLALRSSNTTVRSQMLVAIADLLSGETNFGKLWRRDRQWRGSGFAKVAHRLRGQARVLAKASAESRSVPRSQWRRQVAAFEDDVDRFLEEVQAERWHEALAVLRALSIRLIRLRYGYEGDDENALEFVSAVAPDHAHRYWLVSYLHHTYDRASAPETPWDGLTLLALHVLVYGQPA